MGKRGEKIYASGTLTEAGRNAKIMSGLRNASKWWKPKMQCLERAYVGTRINIDTGRMAKHFKCASCGGEFPAKKIDVDHINGLVDACGFVSWDDLIDRLFCEVDGLQALCKDCHKVKSDKEKRERADFKRQHQ